MKKLGDFFKMLWTRLGNLRTTIPGLLILIFTLLAAFKIIPETNIQLGVDTVNGVVTGLLAVFSGISGLAYMFSKDPKLDDTDKEGESEKNPGV